MLLTWTSYGSSVRRALGAAVLSLLMTVVLAETASGQLNGTYTIGSGGNYASIDAAVSAISSAPSVTGPVTMLIRGGTYSAPTYGWNLPAVSGMSSTNRITIKPYPGETVSISGAANPGTGIFLITGSYYTIDGSNGNANGTSRDLTISQTGIQAGHAIRVTGNADENIIRNAKILSAASSYYGTNSGNIIVWGDWTGGPDNTLIEGNVIGDSSGSLKSWMSIYVGSYYSSGPAAGTTIRNNVILNASNSSGQYYNAYTIAVEYFAPNTTIERNMLHSVAASLNTYHYAIAVFDMYGYAANVKINANRIRNAYSSYSQDSYYPIYIYAYGSYNNTHRITNNFIHSGSTTSRHYVYGHIQVYAGGNSNMTIDILHNTVYSAGSGTDYSYGYLYYMVGGSGAPTLNYRNNLNVSTRTSGGFYHMYVVNYNFGPSGLNSSDNVFQSALNLSYYIYTPYYGTSYSTTSLTNWQAQGHDARSFATVPTFVNAANSDFHIDTTRATMLEGRGYQTGLATDIDGDARATSPYLPDIGADEYNFIGTGLRITSPTSGAQLTSGFATNVTFNTTRPMNTRLELSTNNGATWTFLQTIAPTTSSSNVVSVMMPDIETTQGRVRVVSNTNGLEADTSAAFTLVRPVFTMINSNGGENYVPTDTATLRWSSQFVPPTLPVQLDYSLDGGINWINIIPSVTSLNLPAINQVSWIIPNTPSSNVRMRVKPVGPTILGDSSNAAATITLMPSVTLTAPGGGAEWFVTERRRISWTTTTTQQLRVEYSTDGGAQWNLATTNATFVPATQGGYDWLVPDEPTANALVRLTNIERPRFFVISDAFSIIKGSISLDATNSGEKYELGQPVTIPFTAPTSDDLNLLFSADGGASWSNINPQPGVAISASAGSVDINMPTLPTKRGLLRIVDAEREWLFDESDQVFEIMEAPGISIFTPAQGDEIVRSTTASITWSSNRISRVNIDFSSNGGATYQRIATSVDAATALYSWSVPSTTTPSARIRFTDMSGNVLAESGIFAIVDAPSASLRVTGPNGGERFLEGQKITIRWEGTNVPTVSVRYSSDGGTNWTPIATNIPAIYRQVDWMAPNVPGTRYRVSVHSASPSILDMSDADFEIAAVIEPSVTMAYPAGGETMYVGDTMNLSWGVAGTNAPIDLSYSVDDGATWKSISTLAGGSTSHMWVVPDDPTLARKSGGLQGAPTARIKVAAGAVSATSNGFSIARRQVASVALTTQNNTGEVWREGSQVTIGWQYNVISTVDIHLSTDDGATWSRAIATGVQASLMSYTWTVPHLADAPMTTLRVKISDPSGTPSDVSDTSFSFQPVTNSAGEITGIQELALLGAFPNPFATSTEIRWHQRTVAPVSLRVYDAKGSIVAEQSTGVLSPGAQSMTLTAGTMPNGLYVYELRIGAAVVRSRVTLTR